MKIEVGKFYKTRDGRKVRIYATDGTGPYSVHGSIYPFCGPSVWYEDGRFRSFHETENDIVSEWEAPRDFEKEVKELARSIDSYFKQYKPIHSKLEFAQHFDTVSKTDFGCLAYCAACRLEKEIKEVLKK